MASTKLNPSPRPASKRNANRIKTKRARETQLPPTIWQTSFHQLDVAIAIKNLAGEVVYANPKLSELLEMPLEKIVGKTVEKLLSGGDDEQRQRLEAEREKRRQGESSVYEAVVKLTKKRTKTVRVSATPIFDEENHLLGRVGLIEDITALKSASDAEALLKAVFVSADIGMCVTNSKGKFVEVNPAYCRTYGYAREELIEQPFTKVLPPELREYAQKLHDEFIAEGTDDSAGEWQVMHKNGSIRDILVTAARLILADGRRFKVTTVTDITERKWIESQLRYQANLLQNVSDAIISTNNDFKITSWNKAAETIYGWKEDNTIGKPIHEIVPTQYPNEMTDEEVMKHLKETGEWSGEVVQKKKDGTEIIVQSSVSLLRSAKGDVIGTVAINRDITEKKALERERAELYEQLQQIQKMEAIGTLSGGIAHDFNNILAAILGNANLIIEKTQDERLKRYAERIKVASERGGALTKQLLGFARKGKYEVAPVDLLQSVKNVVEILEHTIDKRIQLRVESVGRIPKVSGDRTQLEQVILNVAVNAVDAIMPTLEERQSGTLSFSLKVETPEERHFKSSQPYLHLVVSDSGIGIPKEIQSKIFQPFFTTKEVGKGTGLGLAMVFGIVKNHHGRVYVESEVGKGTTIHLYLPALVELQSSQGDLLPIEKSQKNMSSNKKVLIVDDEEMLRELLVEQLVDAGYGVYEAANGQEAVETLKNLNLQAVQVNAVVLDMNMPQMSGAKAFAEIRSLFPDIPILIATGYAQDELVRKLLESGASGVLSKPYNVEDLLKKLEEMLKK